MAWDKTKPDGGAAVSIGDDTIRANMEHIEDYAEVEHDFLTGSGRHKIGNGTVAARDAISDWVNGSIWFNTEAGTIEQRRAGAWVPIPHAHYGTAAERATLASDLGLGHAGTTFGTSDDDDRIYVWDGTAFVTHSVTPTVPKEQVEIITGSGTLQSSVFTVPIDANNWGIQAWGKYNAFFNATFPERIKCTMQFKDDVASYATVDFAGNKDTNPNDGADGDMSASTHWMVLGLTDGEDARFQIIRSGGDSGITGTLMVRMFPYETP